MVNTNMYAEKIDHLWKGKIGRTIEMYMLYAKVLKPREKKQNDSRTPTYNM